MKPASLLPVALLGVVMLFAIACTNHKADPKLIGEWNSQKDGKLKITDKQFTMESDSPEPEDYFVKGDTIYTSFEGNLPYTKYVIKKLDEHQLNLFTPDSTTISFKK
jgi:hypothetical protein